MAQGEEIGRILAAVAVGFVVFVGLVLVTGFGAYPNRLPQGMWQAHFVALQAMVAVLTTAVVLLWGRRQTGTVSREGIEHVVRDVLAEETREVTLREEDVERISERTLDEHRLADHTS